MALGLPGGLDEICTLNTLNQLSFYSVGSRLLLLLHVTDAALG